MGSLRSTGIEDRYRRRPAHSCRGGRWVSSARSRLVPVSCPSRVPAWCSGWRSALEMREPVLPEGRQAVPRARAPGACYSDRVGQLDNIIARNRRPNRLHERLIVSLVMGLIVLVIIGLAVFTDL